ncbi:MAG: S53 family peptidase [Sphingomonas sp.]|uniref:S53 family peptidase n=1 Tax=Sphingomonas sp. TaxID=28214 RepID=UPI003F80A862
MKRLAASIAAFALMAGVPASLLQAQSAQGLLKSGNVYHAAVCPGPVGPETARCHARIVTDDKGKPIERDAGPNVTPSGLKPADLRAAYNITGQGSSTTTVAIVDAYGYTNAESDLATYRSTFGLPACTTGNGCFAKYNQAGVKGSYPRQNNGWAQETALDLDMVSAMCPGCKIILVEANSASFADLAAAVNTAASLGARVISNSYGGGESGSQAYESAYDHIGVAVTVSSGDNGYGVQFPASSPHVIAVGGTSLKRNTSARGWGETAWSGAGSGCSTIYSKPSWQLDGGCAMRMEADVSAVADPATGVAVYGPGNGGKPAWLVFGGTSVAAPLIGGIYGVNGAAVNYGSDPYAHTGALYDVTSGSNGSCGGTYFCTARAGYDGPTGLGTPNGITAF